MGLSPPIFFPSLFPKKTLRLFPFPSFPSPSRAHHVRASARVYLNLFLTVAKYGVGVLAV